MKPKCAPDLLGVEGSDSMMFERWSGTLSGSYRQLVVHG